MPALVQIDCPVKILYLGAVLEREETLSSSSHQSLALGFGGFRADSHMGITRGACSRVKDLYPSGVTIFNTRQLSIVSQEDLDAIAQEMGIEVLRPEWIGASMVVSGIPDFTHIPPSSRLQAPSGATVTIDMENRPCMLPAPIIEAHCPDKGKLFKSAAKGRRGVTAWVEREGEIRVGDELKVFIPDQPEWSYKKDF